MKVEIRFRFSYKEKRKKENKDGGGDQKTLRIDKQVVDLNFLSISSHIFVDLKKKIRFLYKVS